VADLFCEPHETKKTLIEIPPAVIVESRRDIPYGTINLQKFAHFYVLSAHYIALLRAI
jgi:hypothetical protein